MLQFLHCDRQLSEVLLLCNPLMKARFSGSGFDSVQNIVNYTEDKHLVQRVAQDQEMEVAISFCF